MSSTNGSSNGTHLAARIVDAVKVYGSGESAVRALDGVSLEFPRRTFTAVMGPSGSGKSTLLHCLAALDSLTSGSVQLAGRDLSSMRERELTLLRREHIGFVFQSFNLVPTLSALENIRLPLDLAGHRPDQQWLDTVIDTLELRSRLRHRPSELSGGQQQRVAVARALATRPELVFADEPTGNLDSRSGSELLGFLRRAVDEFGQAIVMVTHDAGAAAWADRVVFLQDGRVAGELASPTRESVLDMLKQLGDDELAAPTHRSGD